MVWYNNGGKINEWRCQQHQTTSNCKYRTIQRIDVKFSIFLPRRPAHLYIRSHLHSNEGRLTSFTHQTGVTLLRRQVKGKGERYCRTALLPYLFVSTLPTIPHFNSKKHRCTSMTMMMMSKRCATLRRGCKTHSDPATRQQWFHATTTTASNDNILRWSTDDPRMSRVVQIQWSRLH